MRSMSFGPVFVPALAALALLPTRGDAGANAGGTLILHIRPDYDCSQCTENCGDSAIATCLDAITETTTGRPSTWWVFASFPEDAEPRLRGLTFGVDYDLPEDGGVGPYVALTGWGTCGQWELTNSDWPAPGSGTAVTWTETQTSHLTEVYWFTGYEYYGLPAIFSVIPHPTQGGYFGDDSVPSILDPIAAYGVLGFGGNPGYLPCPDGQPIGACCLADGTCVAVTSGECVAAGGTYQGDGVPCEPDPCVPSPTLETSWGRIKEGYR